jgi:hypothetical protein
MWPFKKKQQEIKEFDTPYQDGGKMKIQTLTYNDREYIRIDHLIFWLKNQQEINSDFKEAFHYVIRSIIKVKNQKL